ncbi:uncharacterized protein LOC126710065 [Quercus robur]|uniref:uncharacterized protein LOC126710065 n=1 Tax=Quercus robur TaxID=38942 RepID=UPI0021625791|nr:uncharacterized protein LOC126710065 [Quercus robur]
MAAEDVCEVGFEEGMLWLPSHVLDEACDTKVNMRLQQQQQHHQLHHQQQQLHHRKLPKESLPQNYKSSSRPQHRQKNGPNWAAGGPGMQAIFLESGRRSCGTGVFLPQRLETNFQSKKKPACSPVLLPSRVVQALNLNVHALGLQISPRQDAKSGTKDRDCNSDINKNGKDLQAQCCVLSQNQNSSPEIFLPKEWTY